MTESVAIYDTGMLLALIRRQSLALALHERARQPRHRPVVPGPVLAQAWRPDRATAHALSVLVQECTVPQARSAPAALRTEDPGRNLCFACSSGPDLSDWRRIGHALATAALPKKKRPDVVDASVAFAAARHGSAVIFTSDPEDLAAYLTALDARGVHLAPV